jgi:hypothetical protein
MDARILIKYSTSKCNKEILQFLHQNIVSIKKKFALKIIIVYDDLIPKLGKNIKQLPVLIIDGKTITGNSAIYKHLTVSKIAAVSKKASGSDLEDYWNKEMHSGVDNELDENDDMMDSVKKRAMDQTHHHKENSKQKQKKRATIIPDSREDNIQLQNVGEKISDLVSDDPMMQKFWANQESTPGFE